MTKFKKSTIAKCVLATLAVGGVITIAAIAPNSLQMLKMFGVDKKRYKSQSVYRTLKRMEKQNIIEIVKETDNKTTIFITKNGKNKLIEHDIDNMEIKKPAKWDGKWRIISFDIPEKQKTAREALRMKLKDFDFYHLQKACLPVLFPAKTKFILCQKYLKYENISLILKHQISPTNSP